MQNLDKKSEYQGPEIDEAISILNDNRLIVYPTDTLYGLGADPFSEIAMTRLYNAKKRPPTMPVPIAVHDLEMAGNLAYIDDRARILFDKFMPGKLTIVLPKKEVLPDFATAYLKNVGLRIPAHPFVLGLTKKFGPITATSANVHAQEEPHDIKTAYEQLGESVDLYLDCGVLGTSKPSTIVDLTGKKMRVIREGAISISDIDKVLSNIES